MKFQTVKGTNRLEVIDAWRGVAALSVLMFHARWLLWEGESSLWHREGIGSWQAWIGYLTSPFGYGWLGVPCFFVLSGLCIHSNGAKRLAEDKNNMNWTTFFKRRFLRIYPTYFAALIFAGIVCQIFPKSLAGLSEHFNNSVFAFLVNSLSLQGFLSPPFGGNGSFWTLSLEIHLYLFYPVLFYFSRRVGALSTLIFSLAISIFTMFCIQIFHLQSRLPFWEAGGPIFTKFLFTWTVGFYLAEARAGRAKISPFILNVPTGLVLLAIGLLLRHFGWGEFSELFYGLGFGALVWVSLDERFSQKIDIGLIRILALVGVFSYSLYAIHAPTLLAVRALIDPNSIHRASYSPLLAGCVFSIVMALILYFTVEQWSIRRQPKPTAPQ
jgi:peptidoglycan/LPS O-acetylase OafA/YrhL